jgi:hypothetical protein
MKKIYLLTLCAGLLFSSCEKFLETKPSDTVIPEAYFNTEAEAEIALAGVYDILGKSNTYGRNLFYDMDLADDAFAAQSTWVQEVSLYNYSPSDTKITDLWSLLYTGINRANILLENIDRVPIEEEKRNAIKGQALFLRAYYYFILTVNWGDVPLRLSSTKDVSDNNLPFSPYKEVYDQIVSDMEKAEGLVYPVSKYSNAGRVSKSVVWGILARVNLKMATAPLNDISRYEDVITWTEKVIAAGHSLNPDYREVFKKMCRGEYDTKETIWEVEFNRFNGTQNEEGSVGSINGIAAGANTPWGYSLGSKHATQQYFESFENDTTINLGGVVYSFSKDMRRDWTISPFHYTTNGAGLPVKNLYNTSQIYNRMDAKWRREYESIEIKFQGTTTINFPLLRFSDVYLMYAEATAASDYVYGSKPLAIQYLNIVRRRAYGKNLGEGVRYVEVTNGGTGYTTEPEVRFVGGSGHSVAARATVNANGVITGVQIHDEGMGYAVGIPPTVQFVGTGSGAIATVTPTDRAALNVDLDFNDSFLFLQAVKKERMWELGYEGLRRFDLVRWGDFVFNMDAIGRHINQTTGTGSTAAAYNYAKRHGENVTSRDTLFAIPSREILMNKSARQNRGW